MKLDLRGRVTNLRLGPRSCLHPLFEAVSNSIHAIESRGEARGKVRIRVDRDPPQAPLPIQDLVAPITSFHVEDTGVGFTEENYDSFQRSDTTYKAHLGGKGVGRLFWLKAFQKVEVKSAYSEDGSWCCRKFDFTIPGEGVDNSKLERAESKQHQTVVSLLNVDDAYQRYLPKALEKIAEKIAEHFYPSMFLASCPEITLVDEDNVVDVMAVFREVFASKSSEEEFQAGDNILTIRHIRNAGTGSQRRHSVHLCAHGRTVKEDKVKYYCHGVPSGRIPEIENGSEFWYAALISGKALDDVVNPERTDLVLPERSEIEFPDLLTLDVLRAKAGEKVEGYLDAYLQPLLKEKKETVRRYIHEKAPEYRPILKHRPKAIERIVSDIADEATLDGELHRIQFEAEQELKTRATELSSRKVETVEDFEKYRSDYLGFLEKEDDFGKSALARYIVHRKVVLDLMARFMEFDDDGRYQLEELVHRVVCPLRITSDEAEFGKHNLWLIDERLAYHQFFASDTPLSATPPAESVSGKEPDLIIFDRSLGFADSDIFDSVVIVEFKRPERDDYRESSNPISQVLGYIQKIREGRAKNTKGQTVPAREETQFYAYIIATLTPSLKRQAEDFSFHKTVDGQGYFHFNPNRNAYVEIMDYRKVLRDSQHRNRILFKKLGLPSA